MENGCRRSPLSRPATLNGPFEITYGYWRTAFNITDNDITENSMSEYVECTKNTWCSIRTVQHFNKRVLPACMMLNNKTQSPCEYALMLHLRGHCNEPLDTGAKRRLHFCLEQQLWSWLGH